MARPKLFIIQKPPFRGKFDWVAYAPDMSAQDSNAMHKVFSTQAEAIAYAKENPVYWENMFTGQKILQPWSIDWVDKGMPTYKISQLKRIIDGRK